MHHSKVLLGWPVATDYFLFVLLGILARVKDVDGAVPREVVVLVFENRRQVCILVNSGILALMLRQEASMMVIKVVVTRLERLLLVLGGCARVVHLLKCTDKVIDRVRQS